MHNQDAIHASLGGSLGVPMDDRFDGVGKLTQVYPAQSGVASYALVDKEGKVKQFVTAAPGVNLRPYIGREVGVQGTLGYMPERAHQPRDGQCVALIEEGRMRQPSVLHVCRVARRHSLIVLALFNFVAACLPSRSRATSRRRLRGYGFNDCVNIGVLLDILMEDIGDGLSLFLRLFSRLVMPQIPRNCR